MRIVTKHNTTLHNKVGTGQRKIRGNRYVRKEQKESILLFLQQMFQRPLWKVIS